MINLNRNNLFARIQPEEFELSNYKPQNVDNFNNVNTKSKISQFESNQNPDRQKSIAPVVFRQKRNNSKDRYVKPQ